VAVGAAYSLSGVAMPVGPADASEGGYAHQKIAWPGGIESKTSALIPS
jgi:hypothetical protein